MTTMETKTRQISFQFLAANGSALTGSMPFDPTASNYEALKQVWREHFPADTDFEHVLVWHDGKYTDMFVDEVGRTKGLPLNTKATTIYRANVQAHENPPPPPSTMPAIYGDVLLFSERIWF